ncbi:Aminomethyltransferase [Mycolicibacterium chlorophenolicum]|uniref:Aminomethyltransferase n=2 Tax=Mycolicibacterium chlorophenolicum TaxID=37916 RepID=A0A0J6WMF5_9MYCO|nr:Aminomethyltransferase [Mycolicibacterium chlorophenolicum]
MLRSAPLGRYQFPVLAPEYSTWGEEQQAWRNTALFYDLSFHMLEVYIKGPDLLRLLSDVTANNVSNFGKNRGKQLIACNHEGQLIGDAILFGLEDDECVVVGTPFAPDWVSYQAATGGYDVEVFRDEGVGTYNRRGFRYQVQGPNTQQIVQKASAGTLPDIKFFKIGEFTIAGHPVRALNHAMTKLPGLDQTGLEIYGPIEYRDEVKAALLAAGEEFGLKEGGALSYSTTGIPDGWLPLPLPAIYSSDKLQSYREYLPAVAPEASISLGGSFASDNVEDYYVTPWDVGYGKVIKLDRDFIGAEALRAAAEQPHRQKVWLRWNNEDVTQAWARSLFSDTPTKTFSVPNPVYSTCQYDAVLLNDEPVGVSTWTAYSRNVGGFSSLAMIDADQARDGTEVTVIWGEPNGGSGRPHVEHHIQIPIRATISTTAPE